MRRWTAAGASAGVAPLACLAYAATTMRHTSSGSSTTWSSVVLGLVDLARADTSCSAAQSMRPCQYVDPTSSTGKCLIVPVWISVSDSNSSSSVPYPPGNTTKAEA